MQEAVQQSADTQLRHRDAEIAQLRAELAAMAQTKSRDVVPQRLVSLLKTAAAAGAGADGEAAAARGEGHAAGRPREPRLRARARLVDRPHHEQPIVTYSHIIYPVKTRRKVG